MKQIMQLTGLILALGLVMSLGSNVAMAEHASTEIQAETHNVRPIFQTDCASILPSFVSRFQGLDPDNPRLECWLILVPENYDNPGGRQISLSFYRVKSKAAQPAPDPVLYMPGGPGGGSYSSISFFAVESFNNPDDNITGPRDVIALDPRGTFPTQEGQENPISECPESYEALYSDIYGQTDSLGQEYEAWKQGFRACLNRLRGEGWDFNQYNTRTMVRDLEEVRKAASAVFGYQQQWNLYSESYGTLQALHYMRTYPQNVRSSLLDSVTLPTTNYETRHRLADPAIASLSRLFAECEAISECDNKYPDVRWNLLRVVGELDRNPRVLSLTQPITGNPVQVRFTGQDVMGLVAGALYRPDLNEGLLSTIQAAAAGNYIPLDQFIRISLQGFVDGGLAMKAAVICGDYGRIGVQDSLKELKAVPYLWQSYGLVANVPCEAVNVPSAPSNFNKLVTLNAPSLVIAGEFDPITPAKDARDLMRFLPNGELALFDNLSHVPVRRNACAQDVFRSFFSNPTNPDLSCVAEENAKPISY